MPLIRFLGHGDNVIYDGEGEIDYSGPLSRVDRLPSRVFLLMRPEGGPSAQLDVTELLRNTPHDWQVEYEGGRVCRTTVRLDISWAATQSLIRVVEDVLRTPVDRVAQAAHTYAEGGYVRPESFYARRDELTRYILQVYGLDLSVFSDWERCEISLHEPVCAPHPDYRGPEPSYDELIAATRAEFPVDPYDYGRRHPQGPMRWTPPPEGEKVASCPA
jgi:hypothetical protein